MEILEIKVLRGNYWSIRRPKLTQMKLDLEEMEQRPTNQIPGFRKRLVKPLPTLLLTLLVLAINTKATTYYVSPSGSDSNPGAINSPFKSWQKLSSVLKAGDTGYLRGGTYKSPLSPGASDWIVTW